MNRNVILLTPLLAGCLFACGAAQQPAEKTQTTQTQTAQTKTAQDKPARIAQADTETPAPAASDDAAPATPEPAGNALEPVGAVSVKGLPLPEKAPEDWRKVAPDHLILLQTAHGVTLIELSPFFAPNTVKRYEELAHKGYFKGLPFHRVIKDFMAQAGETSLVGQPAPTTPTLKAEFTFRRAPSMKMTVTGEHRSSDVGFMEGFPMASQNPGLSTMTVDGKVDAWPLHCPGAVASARLPHDVNSSNTQFYITTSYPENLDKNYTLWGRVRAGLPAIFKMKVGEPPFPPDLIQRFELASDMGKKAPQVWVMNTESPAFQKYLDNFRNPDGVLTGVCNIMVPVIVRWPDGTTKPAMETSRDNMNTDKGTKK